MKAHTTLHAPRTAKQNENIILKNWEATLPQPWYKIWSVHEIKGQTSKILAVHFSWSLHSFNEWKHTPRSTRLGLQEMRNHSFSSPFHLVALLAKCTLENCYVYCYFVWIIHTFVHLVTQNADNVIHTLEYSQIKFIIYGSDYWAHFQWIT